MSSDRLDIAIRAVNEASKAIREVKKDLEGVEGSGNKAKSGLEKFGAGMKSVIHGGAEVIKFVGGVAVAMDQIFEIGKRGAQLEYTSQKFDRLSQSIGTTSDVLMKDLKAATRGMVSDAELMGSATDFMALGLVKNHDEAVRLTRAAGALNMNMNQLVLTLTNMTTMRFDALGVSVDGFKEKVKALEAQGLSAEEAFREAFLQQAEGQIAKVGDAADSAIAPFQRLDVATENLKNTFERLAVGPLASAAEALTIIIDGSNQLRDAFVANQTDMQKAVVAGEMSLEDYNKGLKDTAFWAGQYTQSTDLMADSTIVLNDNVKLLNESQLKAMRIEAEYTRGKQELAALTQEVTSTQAKNAEIQRTIGDLYEQGRITQEEYTFALKEWDIAATDGKVTLDELDISLDKHTGLSHGAAQAQRELRDAQREATEAARGQIQAYLDQAQALKDSTALEIAKAGLNDLDQAYKDHRLTAEDYMNLRRDLMLQYGLATEASLAEAGALDQLIGLLGIGRITTDEYQTALGLVKGAAADGEVTLDELGIVLNTNTTPAMDTARGKAYDLEGGMTAVGGAAATSAGQMRGLGDAINALPTYRQITIETRLITTDEGTHRGGPGARAGQGFQHGGVAFGPASGYPVTLHGTEAILPLRDTNRTLQLMLAVLQQMAGGMVGRTVNFYTSAPLSAERDGATIRALAGAI